MEKRWESIDLKITETDTGLLIAQSDARYLAREWKLSAAIESVIDKAIDSGLGCLIRSTHPQINLRLTKGVHHIGFSQSPEERWVFVLDQYSSKGVRRGLVLEQVTFEKHFRGILTSSGIPFTDERGGGKNIFVRMSDLDRALTACGTKQREDIKLAFRIRVCPNDSGILGHQSEAWLESWVMQNWNSLPFGRRLNLLYNQLQSAGRIDILAEDRKTKSEVIFELKLKTADRRTIDKQLAGYVADRRKFTECVWGAVIARDYHDEALSVAMSMDFPLELYRFFDDPGGYRLEKVWGNWDKEGLTKS